MLEICEQNRPRLLNDPMKGKRAYQHQWEFGRPPPAPPGHGVKLMMDDATAARGGRTYTYLRRVDTPRRVWSVPRVPQRLYCCRLPGRPFRGPGRPIRQRICIDANQVAACKIDSSPTVAKPK
ncbi:hypothetical protein J6590_025112 [Homalodisca vitripennis]|nr:hypothetical protein J6590_025112 [Homalodisca vitripennis]